MSSRGEQNRFIHAFLTLFLLHIKRFFPVYTPPTIYYVELVYKRLEKNLHFSIFKENQT